MPERSFSEPGSRTCQPMQKICPKLSFFMEFSMSKLSIFRGGWKGAHSPYFSALTTSFVAYLRFSSAVASSPVTVVQAPRSLSNMNLWPKGMSAAKNSVPYR